MSALLRRQHLLTKNNISKLAKLSKEASVSETEIVRRAIDAYDLRSTQEPELAELSELVATRLREAIADTQQTRARLNDTLKKLGVA